MKQREGNRIICPVCPHHCSLAEGQYGRCRARKNENGTIISTSYGKLTALMLDPIEKKPLRRFHPGSQILSVGSFGCNLSCPFCQNYEISMCSESETGCRHMSPEELADLAEQCKMYGNIGVAFTYNEPLISYEYVRDTACLVHARGLKNVLVTNGTAELSVQDEILPYIDAMNIDLKGFSEGYYKKLGGDLKTVKHFIERAAGRDANCHVELTTLIVPGENDSEEKMEQEAQWIASINHDIPLHVTRFFPRYKMTDRAATDVEKIYRLKAVAEKHLKWVYAGNC